MKRSPIRRKAPTPLTAKERQDKIDAQYDRRRKRLEARAVQVSHTSQSARTAKRNRDYSKLKAGWLPGRSCEGAPYAEEWGVECQGVGSTVQHKRGRVGDLLLDTDHWAAMCWPCHHHVDANPADGYRTHLAEHRGRVESFYQDKDGDDGE